MNIIEAVKAALEGKGIKHKTSLGFFAFSEKSGIKDLYFFRPQHLYACKRQISCILQKENNMI